MYGVQISQSVCGRPQSSYQSPIGELRGESRLSAWAIGDVDGYGDVLSWEQGQRQQVGFQRKWVMEG
jgi:hypothetical protein